MNRMKKIVAKLVLLISLYTSRAEGALRERTCIIVNERPH